MHQLDPGPEGVMAHKSSSPEAETCQNSAVHCGLMFFIHLPSACSIAAEGHSVYVYVCERMCLCVMPLPTLSLLLSLSVHPAILKTIFFLINHANNVKQIWSESSREA